MVWLHKSIKTFNATANSNYAKSYDQSRKLKIISFFIIFIIFFIAIVKINKFYKKYSCYNAGVKYLNANRFVDATNMLALAGDYKDAKLKLRLASKHVFGQLDDCLKPIGIEMVICPAGSYIEIKKDKNSKKEVRHTIKINHPFAISKYEITQAQYIFIMKKNNSDKTDLFKPQNFVSWNDANEFCDKLNKMFANKLSVDYKFDLPTDKQWEYACRSGKNNFFYEGPTEGNLNEVAWFFNNSGDEVPFVGQKKPNAWGIYDMYGNVWEWCKNSDNEKCLFNTTNSIDTNTTHKEGSCRILRGGSFKDNKILPDKNVYCALPNIRLVDVGFRLAFIPTSL